MPLHCLGESRATEHPGFHSRIGQNEKTTGETVGLPMVFVTPVVNLSLWRTPAPGRRPKEEAEPEEKAKGPGKR